MKEGLKTILICPLNWGLGHATRDIPIIRLLIKQGYHVIIATEAPLSQLFSIETPEAEIVHFPGPHIEYSIRAWWLLPKLFIKIPSWLIWLRKEKKITKQLVHKYKPRCIISDNRYGVRYKGIKSILITHQLMIKLPRSIKFLERPLHLIIKRLISYFDECWVPDYPLPNSLAGDLVHKYPLPSNVRLIGPLSRWMNLEVSEQSTKGKKNYDVLVILSGPEPQRSLFEQSLINALSDIPVKSIFIRGKPGYKNKHDIPSTKQIDFSDHLPDYEFLSHLEGTAITICRSGYSSLMDLWHLNKRAIMVPTPGQTEQSYLGEYHKHQHKLIYQNQISTKTLSSIISSFKGKQKTIKKHNSLLENAISRI